MKKTHDLCVKTGTYEKDGKGKSQYLNVGFAAEGEYGEILFISKMFNPAGVPGQEKYSNVPIVKFPVGSKDREVNPL